MWSNSLVLSLSQKLNFDSNTQIAHKSRYQSFVFLAEFYKISSLIPNIFSGIIVSLNLPTVSKDLHTQQKEHVHHCPI